MFIQFLYKNKNYIISKRNFLCDYSRIKSEKIDMTLSGKYLSKYEKINIDFKEFDKYPSYLHIEKLETEIKKIEKTPQEIILGAGANGILQNIVKILFINKGNLVTPFYTFNQVEFAVTSFGGYTKRVYTNDYNIDFDKIKKSIDRKTRMVYICNPNNPTGLYVNSKYLLNFAKSINIPVVIDESGIEFTNKKSILSYKQLPNNLIVVRSFSKAYGIASFRIGYMACNKEFKQKYIKNITTNEFSGLSCIIALNLLKNGRINVKKNIEHILNEKKKILKELKKIGIDCINSNSNTIMTKTTFDENFMKNLINNHISVVPIYDEENKIHIRIAIQTKETNEKFISILKTIYKK